MCGFLVLVGRSSSGCKRNKPHSWNLFLKRVIFSYIAATSWVSAKWNRMILRQGFVKLLFLNADRLRFFSFHRLPMWFCGFANWISEFALLIGLTCYLSPAWFKFSQKKKNLKTLLTALWVNNLHENRMFLANTREVNTSELVNLQYMQNMLVPAWNKPSRA